MVIKSEINGYVYFYFVSFSVSFDGNVGITAIYKFTHQSLRNYNQNEVQKMRLYFLTPGMTNSLFSDRERLTLPV